MLSSHIPLSLSFRFSHQNFVCASFLSWYIRLPSRPPLIGKSNNISRGVHIAKLLTVEVSAASCYTISLRSKYSPQHPVLKKSRSVCFLNVTDKFSHPYECYLLYPV
jgi:hypothetical protein